MGMGAPTIMVTPGTCWEIYEREIRRKGLPSPLTISEIVYAQNRANSAIEYSRNFREQGRRASSRMMESYTVRPRTGYKNLPSVLAKVRGTKTSPLRKDGGSPVKKKNGRVRKAKIVLAAVVSLRGNLSEKLPRMRQ